MAHILIKKIAKGLLFWLILICSLACNKKEPKRYEGEIVNIAKNDTIPVIKQEKIAIRPDIKTIFEKIPNDFFRSSLFKEMGQKEKESIFGATKDWKDVVYDSVNHYIFFDRETKDKNKGILTTIKAFPFNDGAELVVVEISKWSDEDTETEDIRCIKIEKDGSQVELSRYNIFPEIQLQDFFKKDITTKIPAPDHNSMPALLYEIQRNANVIHVFLGEWKHTKEVFSYKPDIDFVELRWESNHFVKIGEN